VRALVLIAIVAVVGCAGRPPETPKPQPPLVIAAATDLRVVLPSLASDFEAKTGRHVTITFGSSGQLADQIRNGAPFTVFLSANRKFVQALADEGHVVASTIAPYATGALALALNPPLDSEAPKLDELANDSRITRVAIANPDLAPYGAAARQALERSKAWEALEPKLVPVDSVDQVAQVVASGAAEAGFVSLAGARDRKLAYDAIDPKLYDPIVQYLGVSTEGAKDSDAKRFAAFVQSDETRAAFLKMGFGAPPSTP
jgi:molybdate transport system substrate-binding protein